MAYIKFSPRRFMDIAVVGVCGNGGDKEGKGNPL